MKVIYSCKGCEDRYPGCHDHCYKYIEEKALRDKEKKEAKLKKSIHIITPIVMTRQ